MGPLIHAFPRDIASAALRTSTREQVHGQRCSMVRVAKELEPLQPQQTDAISKLLEQVLSADGTTIHDTVRPSHQQPICA